MVGGFEALEGLKVTESGELVHSDSGHAKEERVQESAEQSAENQLKEILENLRIGINQQLEDDTLDPDFVEKDLPNLIRADLTRAEELLAEINEDSSIPKHQKLIHRRRVGSLKKNFEDKMKKTTEGTKTLETVTAADIKETLNRLNIGINEELSSAPQGERGNLLSLIRKDIEMLHTWYSGKDVHLMLSTEQIKQYKANLAELEGELKEVLEGLDTKQNGKTNNKPVKVANNTAPTIDLAGLNTPEKMEERLAKLKKNVGGEDTFTHDELVPLTLQRIEDVLDENGTRNIKPSELIGDIRHLIKDLNRKISKNPADTASTGLKNKLSDALTKIQAKNNEARKKRGSARNVSADIDKVFNRIELPDADLLEQIGQKDEDDLRPIQSEINNAQSLADFIQDPSKNIKITYLEDSHNHTDTEDGETMEERKAAVLKETEQYVQKLKGIQSELIRRNESSKNLFEKVGSYDEMITVVQDIPSETIGGMNKKDILSYIEGLKKSRDGEYAPFIHNTESYEKLFVAGTFPTAYGIREGVVRIANKEIADMRATVAREQQEEEKRIKAKKSKDRKVLTGGTVLSYEFQSTDQALEEPGFTEYLNLHDENRGRELSAQAIERGDDAYIQERFEEYAKARKVIQSLENAYRNEIKKDFGDRIQLPSTVFENIHDYVLDTALNYPKTLEGMFAEAQMSAELPEKIKAVEGDIEAVFNRLGGEDALLKMEQQTKEKEERANEIRSSIGMKRHEYFLQLQEKKVVKIGYMDKIKMGIGMKKKVEVRALHEVLNKATEKKKELEHQNIGIVRLITTQKIFSATHDEISIQTFIEDVNSLPSDSPIISEEEANQLLDTVVQDLDNTNTEHRKSIQRENIIDNLIIRIRQERDHNSILAKETKEALAEKDLGFFERRNLVEDIVANSDLLKDANPTALKKAFSPNSLIKHAAEKMEEEVEADKIRISTAKKSLALASDKKKEMLQSYAHAKSKIFFGFAAADETKENIDAYIKERIFGETQRTVNLKRGEKESEAEYKARVAEEEKKNNTKSLEDAERTLGAIRELKAKTEKNATTNPSAASVESIDDEQYMSYMSYTDMHDTERMIVERVQRALEKKIDEAIESSTSGDSLSMQKLQTLLKVWVTRPPQVKLSKVEGVDKEGNKTQKQVSKVLDKKADAIEGEESLQLIKNILAKKVAQMTKKDDAAKKIILTRLLTKINTKTF